MTYSRLNFHYILGIVTTLNSEISQNMLEIHKKEGDNFNVYIRHEVDHRPRSVYHNQEKALNFLDSRKKDM